MSIKPKRKDGIELCNTPVIKKTAENINTRIIMFRPQKIDLKYIENIAPLIQ